MVDGKLFFAIALLSFTAKRLEDEEEEDENFMQMKNSTNENSEMYLKIQERMQRACLVFIHILCSRNSRNVFSKLVRDETRGRWLVSSNVEDEIQPLLACSGANAL